LIFRDRFIEKPASSASITCQGSGRTVQARAVRAEYERVGGVPLTAAAPSGARAVAEPMATTASTTLRPASGLAERENARNKISG
jgi:hypothetical protein